MDKITFSKRTVWLFAAVAVCIVICIFRLFNLQIVNGESYLEKSERRLSRTYTVKAPRGEILDRYGRPLVTNRTSFTVKIEGVGWRAADKPQLICDLISLCGETGQEYLDTLPVTKSQPFGYTYTPGAGERDEKTIVKYLEKNKWSADTSAQDLIRLICEDYEVDLSEKDQDLVAKGRIPSMYFYKDNENDCHLNEKGYKVLGEQVYKKGVELGYWK